VFRRIRRRAANWSSLATPTGSRGRDLWLTIVPALLLAAGAFALSYLYLRPAPPDTIVMSVRRDEGGYGYFAKKYKEFLEKHGVALEVRDWSGETDGLGPLRDAEDGADVTFVEGGPVPPEKAASVQSLGGLYYAPLWVFYRGEPIDDFMGLKGKRVAVGPENSGTRALALAVLGITKTDAPPTVLLPLGRDDAIDQLEAGTIDAAFLVSTPEAPRLRKLAAVPGVRILSVARAEAYTRRFPYLTRLELPRGVFDLAANIPDHDVQLLSPTVNLAVRDTLHPALAYLMLRAASEIHSDGRMLSKPGTFPAPFESGLPLADEARRYYKSGAPLLQRHLPFWAANLIDRAWVMLVPLLAVLIPLMRLVPPLYQWRVRSRIYRWYARLKEVELELEDDVDADRLRSMLQRLDDVDRAVKRIPTPLAYSDKLYAFRTHLDLVRRRIELRLERAAAAVRLIS
jgi:TRAP-type uncharacterized transport system substrate-binding protein